MWSSTWTSAVCAVMLVAFFSPGAAAVNASVPLGGYCNATSNCSAQYSQCISNICQCPAGRVFNSNTNTCLLVAQNVNDSCVDNNQCSPLVNTACLAGRCSCVAGYVYVNGRCVSPASGSSTPGSPGYNSCSSDYDCRYIDNSVCNSGRCVCTAGYQPSPDGLRCTAVGVPIYCNSNSDCSRIRNSQCSSNRCVCRSGYRPTPDGQHCSTGVNLRSLLAVVVAGLLFSKMAA